MMTSPSSLAKVIDGTAVAAYVHCLLYSPLLLNSIHSIRSLRQDIAKQIKLTQGAFPRFQPQLAIVQAGERPDSSVYVRMKSKAAQEVGIKFRHVTVPIESTAEEIVQIVKKLNADESINGILVQLPLGDQVTSAGERLVTEAVSPEKDVDG
jgi:methylenetetrahydrofolate dehydrogenase (NADP+) / methenyltetrahydrofolate cyclohydrolase / formyltetrahydrofolate synthetase